MTLSVPFAEKSVFVPGYQSESGFMFRGTAMPHTAPHGGTYRAYRTRCRFHAPQGSGILPWPNNAE